MTILENIFTLRPIIEVAIQYYLYLFVTARCRTTGRSPAHQNNRSLAMYSVEKLSRALIVSILTLTIPLASMESGPSAPAGAGVPQEERSGAQDPFLKRIAALDMLAKLTLAPEKKDRFDSLVAEQMLRLPECHDPVETYRTSLLQTIITSCRSATATEYADLQAMPKGDEKALLETCALAYSLIQKLDLNIDKQKLWRLVVIVHNVQEQQKATARKTAAAEHPSSPASPSLEKAKKRHELAHKVIQEDRERITIKLSTLLEAIRAYKKDIDDIAAQGKSCTTEFCTQTISLEEKIAHTKAALSKLQKPEKIGPWEKRLSHHEKEIARLQASIAANKETTDAAVALGERSSQIQALLKAQTPPPCTAKEIEKKLDDATTEYQKITSTIIEKTAALTEGQKQIKNLERSVAELANNCAIYQKKYSSALDLIRALPVEARGNLMAYRAGLEEKTVSLRALRQAANSARMETVLKLKQLEPRLAVYARWHELFKLRTGKESELGITQAQLEAANERTRPFLANKRDGLLAELAKMASREEINAGLSCYESAVVSATALDTAIASHVAAIAVQETELRSLQQHQAALNGIPHFDTFAQETAKYEQSTPHIQDLSEQLQKQQSTVTAIQDQLLALHQEGAIKQAAIEAITTAFTQAQEYENNQQALAAIVIEQEELTCRRTQLTADQEQLTALLAQKESLTAQLSAHQDSLKQYKTEKTRLTYQKNSRVEELAKIQRTYAATMAARSRENEEKEQLLAKLEEQLRGLTEEEATCRQRQQENDTRLAAAIAAREAPQTPRKGGKRSPKKKIESPTSTILTQTDIVLAIQKKTSELYIAEHPEAATGLNHLLLNLRIHKHLAFFSTMLQDGSWSARSYDLDASMDRRFFEWIMYHSIRLPQLRPLLQEEFKAFVAKWFPKFLYEQLATAPNRTTQAAINSALEKIADRATKATCTSAEVQTAMVERKRSTAPTQTQDHIELGKALATYQRANHLPELSPHVENQAKEHLVLLTKLRQEVKLPILMYELAGNTSTEYMNGFVWFVLNMSLDNTNPHILSADELCTLACKYVQPYITILKESAECGEHHKHYFDKILAALNPVDTDHWPIAL